MKEYRIIESRPATYYWEYIVTANSETEALHKVLDGNIEASETWVDINEGDDDSDYEIYPANNDNE
jgi:hypothetical protein